MTRNKYLYKYGFNPMQQLYSGNLNAAHNLNPMNEMYKHQVRNKNQTLRNSDKDKKVVSYKNLIVVPVK